MSIRLTMPDELSIIKPKNKYYLLRDASMGSEPGNGAPPSESPLASFKVLDLPQSSRSSTDAMGSITGLHIHQQETLSASEGTPRNTIRE